jgi:hypothetical protein
MGTPIRIQRRVAETITEQTAAWGGEQAVLLCPGDNPRWDECPAVYGFMLGRDLDLRIADGHSSVLLPQSQADALLVLAPGVEASADLLPKWVQPLPALDVPLREDMARYRFYRLSGGQTASGRAPAPPDQAPARLANGVELVSAEFVQPPVAGQTARLLLHWRVIEVPAAPPPQGYSLSNHLLAAGGARIAQDDGPGYRVALWRAGDTLVSGFDLTLPADAPPPPYRLRTGMYVYTPPDQFTTIPVIDAQGNAVANAVEWPVPAPPQSPP